MSAATRSSTSTAEAQLRALIGRLEPKQQKLLRAARSTLRKRFPTAHELVYDYPNSLLVSYSPTENGIDSIVSLAARADRFELFFNHGPKLPDPKKLLQGSGKQTRFIPVDSVRQLTEPHVEGFIAAVIEHSRVPLAAEGKGSLIIKNSKPAKAKSRRPARKR